MKPQCKTVGEKTNKKQPKIRTRKKTLST